MRSNEQLEQIIENAYDELGYLELGSEEYLNAIKSIDVLERIYLEQTKQARAKKEFVIRTATDAGLDIAGKTLNSMLVMTGLGIERDGSITISMLRQLLSNAARKTN